MKRFIISVIIFILPLVLLFTILEYVIRNIPNDYSFKKNHIIDKGNEIETLILGSSHTFMGVNPEYFQSVAFSLANTSQSLFYDKELLMEYNDYMPNLKKVIIPISYFSLSHKLDKGEENGRKYDYLHYMNCKTKILSNKNVKYYSAFLAKGFSKSSRAIKNYVFKGKTPISCNSYGWCTSYSYSKRHDLKSTALTAAKRHENGSLDFSENVKHLEEIINFSRLHNFEVVLINTPTTKYYYDNLDSQKLAKIFKTCSDISEINSIKYFNFSHDKCFTEEDFYDGDHLNDRGATKFSKLLNDKINCL